MSDIDWSDATIDDIREADEDTLNRWVAEERGEPRRQDSELHAHHRWPDWPGAENGQTAFPPQPYAEEWFAAGPLLEELQGTWLTEDDQWALLDPEPDDEIRESHLSWGVAARDDLEGYVCGPRHHLYGYPIPLGRGGSAPEAITRAYLIAAKRGLLEGDDEQ